MKTMFKAATESNLTQLEMSQDVLDLALRITNYIHSNFLESDFFTLGNAEQEDLDRFYETLKDAKNNSEGDLVSIEMECEQFRIFEKIFWYGANFGDDVPELEDYHDEIWDASELVSPKIS